MNVEQATTNPPTQHTETDTNTVPPRAASKPSRLGKRVAIALVSLVGIGAAGAVWATQGATDSAKAASEPSDTPRVEGELILFSHAFAERAGLRTTVVKSAQLVPVVNAVGMVDFNPEHIAAVGTRLRGLVSRVSKFEGDSVDSGTLLAVIESAELGEAQAAVRMLEAEKTAADVNHQREAQLREKNLSTAREAELAGVEAQKYELLLSAARQKVAALAGGNGARGSGRLGWHELRSPLKGTVVERAIAPGQSVEGQLVAFRIANMDHLWVELDVFEHNLSRIRLGDRVELSPISDAAQVFEGRVARVGARIDPDTRSAPLRIEVDNRDRRLRAGQAVNAKIHASGGGAHSSLLVPASAVTYVDGKPTLFVSSGPNAVKVVKVEIGANNGSDVEVLRGLNGGETIVNEGVFALKSELFR